MPCAIFHVPILFLLFLATPLLAGLLDILHYNPDRPIFPQRIDEDCIKSTFGCGCTGRSFSNLTFAASNFDFHASYVWTTPAHQNSWGFLSFNVTNTAVGYDNICIASSNRVPDFFYGDTWYDCDVQGAAGPDVVNSTDVMGAGFTYDRPSGQFHWYQRWACKDQVPETIRINTTSNVNSSTIDLSCTVATWQNPNWTAGQIFSAESIKCDPVDFTFKPSELTAWE